MKKPLLRHHYFANHLEQSRNAWIKQYGDRKDTQIWFDNMRAMNPFLLKFLVNVKKSATQDYHLFIISQPQQHQWEFVVNKYDLKQYMIYDSGMVAHNINHVGTGPRLQCVILKFPDNYAPTINPKFNTETGELTQ